MNKTKKVYQSPTVEIIELRELMMVNILGSLSSDAEFGDWEETTTIEDWGGVDQY